MYSGVDVAGLDRSVRALSDAAWTQAYSHESSFAVVCVSCARHLLQLYPAATSELRLCSTASCHQLVAATRDTIPVAEHLSPSNGTLASILFMLRLSIKPFWALLAGPATFNLK